MTLWDLPDILIGRSKGLPFDYIFPRSGTVVIDDAIGLVRGSQHPEAAKAFIDYVGGVEAQLLAATRGLPAAGAARPAAGPRARLGRGGGARDEGRDRWTGRCSRSGAPAWMGYWDRHVRGTGKRRRPVSPFLTCRGPDQAVRRAPSRWTT